jgi:predicted TIM-barrel fold metal-dependent hydrolase
MKDAVATRRVFLKTAVAAAGAAAMPGGAPIASAGGEEAPGLVDVNLSLGRWPVRRTPWDEPERLVAGLRTRGVQRAWAGNLEALLSKDPAAANARLAEACRRHGEGLLVPFGSIDPRLPGWEEDLRHSVEVHRFRGIRLHPNYHGYRLDDPVLARLLALAAERGLIVQIALVMEDERMMHPLLKVDPVDPAPLADLAARIPGLKLVLVNALRTLRGEPLRKLIAAGNIWVEISMLEGAGGIGNLLEDAPAHRILFGSHAPLFYFQAAELKLRESPLGLEDLRSIRRGNAEALLP